MKLIDLKRIPPQIEELLCLATSKEKVEMEYLNYFSAPNRMLYGQIIEGNIVGCIGLEFVSPSLCEIKHIAVNPNSRKQQIGSDFYASVGFTITSLGEKYPGVERFHCVFKNEKI